MPLDLSTLSRRTLPASSRRWRRIVALAALLVLGVAGGLGAALLPAALEGNGGLAASVDEVREGVTRELRRLGVTREDGFRTVILGMTAPAGFPRPDEDTLRPDRPGGMEELAPDLPLPEELPPVLLVPGWSDRASHLEEFRQMLVEGGWPEDRVLSLDFRDPVGSNRVHAREVSDAVEALRERTGAPRVDVVAFSMGGLAVRHFLLFEDGEAVVRRAVFLGTPHRGTVVAVFAWGDGGREMIPGSPFLERLNAGTLPTTVEMASIRTAVDTRVIPGSSAFLPGAANVEVCCPGHVGLLKDPVAFSLVRRFLVAGAAALPAEGGTAPVRPSSER